MMEIIAWGGAGKVINPICATNSIPVVNFGLELEVSCASGNYMQWTALVLEQLAQRKLEFKCIMVKMGNAEKMGRMTMAKTVAYLGNLLVLEIHLATLMNDLMNALNQMHKTHQV